jgi:hypothetical protein
MGWFKLAKDFGDRNLINKKIAYLEQLKSDLLRLSKVVFQSGNTAKVANFNIINSKKITSYPDLLDILSEADGVALDSPWKFQKLCQKAIDHISEQIEYLITERKNITFGKEKNRKGWF